jgi:hypothetical protein
MKVCYFTGCETDAINGMCDAHSAIAPDIKKKMKSKVRYAVHPSPEP